MASQQLLRQMMQQQLSAADRTEGGAPVGRVCSVSLLMMTWQYNDYN